jgi:hypothetical protein
LATMHTLVKNSVAQKPVRLKRDKEIFFFMLRKLGKT